MKLRSMTTSSTFKALANFAKMGLPCYLPAKKEATLEKDQQLIELKDKIQQLQTEGASAKDIKEARVKAQNYHKTLKRESLQQYQAWWVQDRRD